MPRLRSLPAAVALVLALVLGAGASHAQEGAGLGSSLTDSTAYGPPTPWETKAHESDQHGHNHWRGAGEIVLIEVIPWAYNYYVRDAEFARVGINSWKANMDWWEVWEWDDNNFKTNMFAHPYHGNCYFNAFRTNGHSFWESVPAAWAGALTWEVMGETHPPAPNDLLSTSLGGITLGETTYRLSSLILDNTKTGSGRTWREIGATLVDPVRGFNRLLDGQWNDVMENPREWKPARLVTDTRFGIRRVGEELGDVINEGDIDVNAEFGMTYGRPMIDVKKPFSNFQFRVEYASQDSGKFPIISARGVLHGWPLKTGAGANHTAGIWMTYDYIHNDAVQLGAQGFLGGVLSQFPLGSSGTALSTEVAVAGVPIAAIPEDYLVFGEGRDYDFCMGGGVRLAAAFDRPRWRMVSLAYNGFLLPTVNGFDATHYLQVVSGTLQAPIARDLAVGMQIGHYFRHSDYVDYPDIEERNPYGRIFVTLRNGWDQPLTSR